jgi:TonB family protein
MTEAWKQWEGQVVDGKFHLRTYLGGSDHSGVFLTECAGLNSQKAAIKLIATDPEHADAQLSRWARSRNLSHPHLLRILDAGRCRIDNEKMLYVVTEYAEENLSQIVPQRPLTPSEALDMLRPVLGALAYLHAKKLVHGHLKPGNIMAIDDQLRISSDRIYAVGERRSERSKPDVYDAPETATRGYSSAGDVWSLGVTLVEVLTQQLPVWEFQGQAQPALPSTLPAPFPDVVRHCLQRDPQSRSKISEIAARLVPTAAAPTVQTTPNPESVRPKPPYNPAVLIVAVSVFLALIAFGTRFSYQRTEASRSLASSLKHRTPKPSPALKTNAVVAEQVVEKVGPDPPDPPTPSVVAAVPLAPAPAAPAPVAPVPIAPAPLAKIEPRAVTPTAKIVKGEVAHQVLPTVPQKARDTIRGTLKNSIRVHVDPAGGVSEASVDKPGPSQYFAKLATNAARGWKFTAAKAGGQNIASEWVLRFEFTQGGTKVTPAQVAP